MAATLPGRNDSSVDFAANLGPIGVHHGQRNILSLAQRDHAALPVVTARIDPLQRTCIEDLRRELEVEPPLAEIPTTLRRIPAEAHSTSIRLYIQLGKSNAPRSSRHPRLWRRRYGIGLERATLKVIFVER